MARRLVRNPKGSTVQKRLLIALFSLIAALSCMAPAMAVAAEDANDSLTVGVPADRCPVFYVEEGTREVVGIGVDLMREAAKAAGYDATFVVVEEPTLKEALDNEAYDVVMPFGSAISSASGKPSVVSDNLMQTPFTLVTVGDRDLPSLEHLRVGMLRSLGGGAETVKELYPGIEIVMYDTMADSVKALRAQEVDALLHNSYVWSYVLQKPSYSDLMVQPSTMFSMDFRAGALDTPDGRAIIERLNDGIGALEDTRRQAIILSYTSQRLYKYDFSDYVQLYGLILLLCLALIIALIVIASQRTRTLRLKQEEEMRQLIDHDPLTGALSMKGFRTRVEELLRAHPDNHYLLAYVNFKDLKFINESLGMESGDELLRFYVRKTMATLGDDEAIARLEGDHFAVLRRARGETQMRKDEENVINPVRRYFVDQGKKNQVQICSGIYVLAPKDYVDIDVDHMLDCARVAEKRLRDSRKDGYEFYNPELWEKGKRNAYIVAHLPVALQSDEIQVWYQPQVNYETGEIIGVEALCRWSHPTLGWLLPSEFIPALEENGLIYDLDCFVWERVCQDLQRWNREGMRRPASVNLARNDIREDRNIPGHFYDLVQNYGLPPSQLHVEITESAFVDDPALLTETTVKLRELGFTVEMDDFGSGYSSLHMLKEVPVDRIKLDMHFLGGAGDPERGRVIISHIIQMVRSLGMDLIVEGVEDDAQARFLQSQGCSEMQGFFFYKPMPVQDLEALDGTA